MRFIRILTVASMLCVLMIPVGCGGGGGTEEVTPEQQAEIDAIREQYTSPSQGHSASGGGGAGGHGAPR